MFCPVVLRRTDEKYEPDCSNGERGNDIYVCACYLQFSTFSGRHFGLAVAILTRRNRQSGCEQ